MAYKGGKKDVDSVKTVDYPISLQRVNDVKEYLDTKNIHHSWQVMFEDAKHTKRFTDIPWSVLRMIVVVYHHDKGNVSSQQILDAIKTMHFEVSLNEKGANISGTEMAKRGAKIKGYKLMARIQDTHNEIRRVSNITPQTEQTKKRIDDLKRRLAELDEQPKAKNGANIKGSIEKKWHNYIDNNQPNVDDDEFQELVNDTLVSNGYDAEDDEMGEVLADDINDAIGGSAKLNGNTTKAKMKNWISDYLKQVPKPKKSKKYKVGDIFKEYDFYESDEDQSKDIHKITKIDKEYVYWTTSKNNGKTYQNEEKREKWLFNDDLKESRDKIASKILLPNKAENGANIKGGVDLSKYKDIETLEFLYKSGNKWYANGFKMKHNAVGVGYTKAKALEDLDNHLSYVTSERYKDGANIKTNKMERKFINYDEYDSLEDELNILEKKPDLKIKNPIKDEWGDISVWYVGKKTIVEASNQYGAPALQIEGVVKNKEELINYAKGLAGSGAERDLFSKTKAKTSSKQKKYFEYWLQQLVKDKENGDTPILTMATDEQNAFFKRNRNSYSIHESVAERELAQKLIDLGWAKKYKDGKFVRAKVDKTLIPYIKSGKAYVNNKSMFIIDIDKKAKGGYVFKGDKYEYTPLKFTYTIGGL